MDCRQLERVTAQYHADELSLEECAAFERHVQVCPACARRSHETQRAMAYARQVLARSRVVDVTGRVTAVIGGHTHAHLRWGWALVPAAAVLCIGILVAPHFFNPRMMSSAAADQELELFLNYEVVEALDVLESGVLTDVEVAVS